MSNLLVFWISLGIFAFILEMFTGTLYGLSISLGAFIVATYVYFSGDLEMTILQAFILALSSGLFSYFFPKWFKKSDENLPKIGLEAHIGEVFILQKKSGEYRITIDGVSYLIDQANVAQDFDDGKRVVLSSAKGGKIQVTLCG